MLLGRYAVYNDPIPGETLLSVEKNMTRSLAELFVIGIPLLAPVTDTWIGAIRMEYGTRHDRLPELFEKLHFECG